MADEPKEQQPPSVPTGDKPGESPSSASVPPAKPAGAAAPGAPPKATAPAPPKPPVSLQTPLNNELVTRVRGKFGAVLLEAIEDRKQAILTVERGQLAEIALYLRDERAAEVEGARGRRRRSAELGENLARGKLAGARSV